MSSPSKRRPEWLIPVLIAVIAIVLVTISIVVASRDSEPAADATDSPVAEVQAPEAPHTLEMARFEEADQLAAGPLEAPVTLVVYSDYQCSCCARWAADTGPVMHEYAEAGDLRIEYRDITVFGPESERAALAAYAAGLQDHYLEYHDALFEGGTERPANELTEEALIATAGELGLDTEQFAADYNSSEVADAVERNVQEAVDIGAFSTPAFLLGGRPIVGAQPTDVFVDAFEQALAESGA